MELSEFWGYKVIPLGGWSYREYRVIPPGVIGVIDTELLELWVIRSYPRVDGVIGNTGLYLPGLSELLTWSYKSYGVIRSSTLGYDLITP